MRHRGMAPDGAWKTQPGTAKVNNGGRCEERNGGGRGCGGERNGRDIMMEEDLSGHSQ